MRKFYESPEAEVEKFYLPYNAAITTSDGGNEHGNTGEDVTDPDPGEGWEW